MCGRFTKYLPWSKVHELYRLTLDWDKHRNDTAVFQGKGVVFTENGLTGPANQTSPV